MREINQELISVASLQSGHNLNHFGRLDKRRQK